MKNDEMKNDEMNIKEEQHYLKTLNKIFTQVTLKERYKEDAETLSVMDEASVAMLVSKSVDGKELLRNFIDKEQSIKKEISITYEGGKAKYSTEYLKNIMKVFENDNEGIQLQTGQDQPLTMENKHFKIILAPRADNN